MTKDEALNKALDAFDYIEHNYMSLPATAEKAIAAIKEAFAQPEQEPVAWCVYCDGQFNLNIFRVKDVADVEKVRLDLEYPNHKRKVVPLYTTPPQRKPLTDEEIILIVAECASSHQHTDIHFARAIEAAHGIKELV